MRTAASGRDLRIVFCKRLFRIEGDKRQLQELLEGNELSIKSTERSFNATLDVKRTSKCRFWPKQFRTCTGPVSHSHVIER